VNKTVLVEAVGADLIFFPFFFFSVGPADCEQDRPCRGCRRRPRCQSKP
jgi:hypothetical protein